MTRLLRTLEACYPYSDPNHDRGLFCNLVFRSAYGLPPRSLFVPSRFGDVMPTTLPASFGAEGGRSDNGSLSAYYQSFSRSHAIG